MPKPIKRAVATLAGGCFWCTEAIFKRLNGVEAVEPGYSGGTVENPTYEQVSTGTTGHAEVAQLTFDPSVLSFEKLLEVFFALHDPTTRNRQGADVGTQYRSAVFYHDETQKKSAEEMIKKLDKSGQYSKQIVTDVEPFRAFYPAEDYHKNYFETHSDAPYCRLVIDPKIQKLLHEFKENLKPGQSGRP